MNQPQLVVTLHNGRTLRASGGKMTSFNLDTAVQIVTIMGGLVALVLAGVEIADTWLDITDKLSKRRRRKSDSSKMR